MSGEDMIDFQCNICGIFNTCRLDKLGREDPTCVKCGSTVRMRSIIHLLSLELFGKSIPLWEFPKDKQISGLGLSDWEEYANILSIHLDYCNTYYHQEPRFDISSIPLSFKKKFDFIISSDVFEHIKPPVSIAFINLKKILNENGFIIFTVPYSNDDDNTIEHFPDLFNYEIKERKGVPYLENITREGVHQIFTGLISHGGEGFTLEMRIFSKKSLEKEFFNSGFNYIKFYLEPYLQYGIFWKYPRSLPIVARVKAPQLGKKTPYNLNFQKGRNPKNHDQFPLISIIIVNWNGIKYLKECLESLLTQTYPNIEIILVDNASVDESVKFVERKYPGVKIIYNKENLGFAAGTNIGIDKANGEYIALFNQDAVADENWLSNLAKVLLVSENIGAVSGKIFYHGDNFGKNAVFCTWPKIDPISAFPSLFHNDEPQSEVDYVSGCAMLVKKEVIDKIGLLDPGYFLYFEETDWCARMICAGYKLFYVPEAIARHVVSGSIDNFQIKQWYMIRNQIRFALKNFDLIYIPRFIVSVGGDVVRSGILELIGKDDTYFNLKVRAILWNLKNIYHTFLARNQDKSKITNSRSYNRSLPLKNVKPK